jgi:hypothetical protein
MDVGFIILCPDRNVGGLKNTLGSISHYSYNRESICVVGSDVSAKEINEMKACCQTYKGENTITSLVNVGMKKLKHDWGFIIFAGSRIQNYLERKLSIFTTKDSDILFPVVDRKCNFIEGSFNGVLINTKFFAEVGDFPCTTMKKQGLNDFEFAKMLWAIEAVEKGCTFKGIVGMRII